MIITSLPKTPCAPPGSDRALNFVLIHGSWHTGEHWAPVIDYLRSKGHTAVAPTLLGHGKGVERRVSHAQQVQDLVSQIERENWRDFVAVGHSYGGTIIARLAEEVPDRIRRLVFWNAFVPEPVIASMTNCRLIYNFYSISWR